MRAPITNHTAQEGRIRFHGRILLVEDNLINQHVSVRILATLGLRTDVVEDGAQAIQAVQTHLYDLILMDCQMPEMDGLAATAYIREHLDPDHRIPIVALTANALFGDRERCLESGMDDFLAKPVSRAQLGNMIQRWIPGPIQASATGTPVPLPKVILPQPPIMSEASQVKPLLPVLNSRMIQELQDLGGDDVPDFFITLVDQFLTDLPRHLETIHLALNQQDPGALVRAAHTCKGSCRSIGATSLAEVSYELEMIGREGTTEGASEIYARLVVEQDRTRDALQKERDQFSQLPVVLKHH
jgi:CheY-like chemotaxis protein